MFYAPFSAWTIRPLEYERQGWCPRAAYLEDGQVLAAQRSHVKFIIQALYCVVLYFLLQLPEKYAVRVDLDTFFAAFSMQNEQKKRIRIQPWRAGPGFRYLADDQQAMDVSGDEQASAEEILDDAMFVDQRVVRDAMRAKWEKYYKHVASHTPYAVCKPTADVDLDDDDTGVQSTLKPKTTQRSGAKSRPQASAGGGRPESTYFYSFQVEEVH